jgi:uncharacterized phage protein (TIGR01671 family)
MKYRVWDTQEEKYLKQERKFSFHIDNDGDLYISTGWNENKEPCDFEKADMNRYFKEWSTGHTDSNGKEIYEGDIIQFTYWWFDGNECESTLTGLIVYSEKHMSFQLKGVKNKEWEKHTGYQTDTEYLTPFSELNFSESDFTIIGNNNKNPQMMKRE